MTVNPVLVQDLRQRMRGGTAYLLLTAVILAFGVFTLGTFWALTNLVRPQVPLVPSALGTTPPPTVSFDRLLITQRGVIFFLLMALWAIVLTALIVPGATSGSVARERERATLPLLLGTPLRPLSIVLGKLLGAASYVLLVIAAGIPLFILVIMFGGIPPDQALAVGLIVLVTTFAFTALGVFISSVAPNALAATLITYSTVLILTLGSYAAYLAASPLNKALSMKYLLYFSPLASVMSAMTASNPQLNSVVNQFYREPGGRVSGEWWMLEQHPLWQVTSLWYVLAGVILVVMTARALNPMRRWV